jgi:biopolymer transport protein ExbD
VRIRVKPSRRRLDRITINLASMIDVSFLLLMYFMVATVLEDKERRLSTALQTQGDGGIGVAGDFQPQRVEVRMGESGPVYRLGARSFADRNALGEALQPLPKAAGLFVTVFDDVPVSFAVAAVQVAHDAGFDQVTYVAAK